MKLISDLDQIGRVELHAAKEDTPELWEQAFYSLKAYSDLYPDNLECSLRILFFCWFTRLEYGVFRYDIPREELEKTMEVAYKRATQYKQKNFYDYLWIVGFVLAMGPYMLNGQGDDVGEKMLKQATEIEPKNPMAWLLLTGGRVDDINRYGLTTEKFEQMAHVVLENIDSYLPDTRGLISDYFYMLLPSIIEDFNKQNG